MPRRQRVSPISGPSGSNGSANLRRYTEAPSSKAEVADRVRLGLSASRTRGGLRLRQQRRHSSAATTDAYHPGHSLGLAHPC